MFCWRTKVQFPAPCSGSEPSVTTAPRDLMPSSGLHKYQVCTQYTDIRVGKMPDSNICPHIYVHTWICNNFYNSSLKIYLSVCLSVYLSSVCLSICLSVYGCFSVFDKLLLCLCWFAMKFFLH